MENTVIISCSAATHIGSDRVVNENRIYANGKFLQSHLMDNSQLSLETAGRLFIFALSDGMDSDMDAGSRISIIDELKKFHRKAANSTKDIQVKLDEMAENVQQSNNLLYSMSLGEETDVPRNTAFAGLIIDGGSAAAVSLGNYRIYRVEADMLKPVINDGRKTERLLKMGIINNEQAEILSGQQKNSGLDSSLQVKKSEVFPAKEGSEYLLCSKGLIDTVSEDAIFEIVAGTRELDAAAGQLVREAVENGCEDNVTAMLIRIDQAEEGAATVSSVRNTANTSVRRIRTTPARYSRMVQKKSVDMARLVATFVIIAVIAAVLFGAFTLWMNWRNPDGDKDAFAPDSTTQSPDTSGSTADDTIPDESDAVEGTESSTSTEGTVPGDNEGNGVIGDNTTYTVKSGDSLMKISKQFYGDEGKYKLIMDANGMTDPNKIQVGQEIKIPPEN